MDSKDVIKSISYDEAEIMRNIIKLHVPSGIIDCDPTYSVGNFYKRNDINPPIHKFDITPQADGVIQASADNLPLETGSISTLFFDPPFLISTSKNLKKTDWSKRDKEDKSNLIHQRFSSFETPKKLWDFYKGALQEGYRVLKDDEESVMCFKCMDTVSSGKQYLSHIYIINMAIKIGFYPKDIFILLAKQRMHSGKIRQQVHARKFHIYWLILSKSKKINKINYFE